MNLFCFGKLFPSAFRLNICKLLNKIARPYSKGKAAVSPVNGVN
ncbi:hypothetical protein PAGA_a2182 [Pseudoalteromonas agarivorans DSM 14585]|uniref:Uncharacterized protein n=1 Tax=Pseudoalteromonas agarivorans DSM 14585 TaxID=1312369 RepID=A0ACA8DWZ6_9GAMM|nr:hypothetical protein PAGA_a2182 [Pseudoalteromonas agarivorans DSM 14585]